jgi:hypothetical protein
MAGGANHAIAPIVKTQPMMARRSMMFPSLEVDAARSIVCPLHFIATAAEHFNQNRHKPSVSPPEFFNLFRKGKPGVLGWIFGLRKGQEMKGTGPSKLPDPVREIQRSFSAEEQDVRDKRAPGWIRRHRAG